MIKQSTTAEQRELWRIICETKLDMGATVIRLDGMQTFTVDIGVLLALLDDADELERVRQELEG